MKTMTPPSAESLRSARRLLGIDCEGGGDELANLCRLITKSEYVLPGDQIDALQILVNPRALASFHIEVTRDSQGEAVAEMENVVARFATSFFKLDPVQRRRAWKILADRCLNMPNLRRWLLDLEPGLDVDCTLVLADLQLRDFSRRCCEIFVTRQPERARMRREAVAKYSQQQELWDYVIWNLRLRHGHFANEIAGWLDGPDNARNRVEERPAQPFQEYAGRSIFADRVLEKSPVSTWMVGIGMGLVIFALSSSRSPNTSPKASRQSAIPLRPKQREDRFMPNATPEERRQALRELNRLLDERTRKNQQTTDPVPAASDPRPQPVSESPTNE